MNLTFDQNLFTQIGLDSGLLTMLGSVTHSFSEPGVYRGSVHKADGGQAVFYVHADKDSPTAHLNIDLAALREYAGEQDKECCPEDETANHYTVNPKGFVQFHVSRGTGGFSVHVRRAEEDPKAKVFNSQELGEGDMFSAVILRPGTYSLSNRQARGKGEIVVSYPQIGKAAYRPPDAVHVQVGAKGFDPARIELQPGQGLVFEIKSAARIVIELQKADDGPGYDRKPSPRGWSSNALPETKT